jgi:hypothetical protein
MQDEQEDQGQQQPEPTQQIMRVPAKLEADARGIMPIIPRDIEEAQRYANGLIVANQVPDAFRIDGKKQNAVNVPLVLMGVLKSMEIGLPPQTGLEVLLPLNGRFTVWGDGVMGLIQQSGQVKNYTERSVGPGFDVNKTPMGDWPDDFGFEVRIWRVGQEEPYIGRFTVGDAKRQNLWMNTYKKPWIQSPLRMLKIRARSFAARDGFADCLMGLAIKEEVEDAMPDMADGGDVTPLSLPSLADDEPVTAIEHDTAMTTEERPEPVEQPREEHEGEHIAEQLDREDEQGSAGQAPLL